MPITGADTAAATESAAPAPAEPPTSLLAGLPIETERLRLRPLVLADAGAIERLAGDWEVARYTGSIPHPYPAGGALGWIRETWAEAAAGHKLVAAIERRQDEVLLGCIELDLTQDRKVREERLAALGYWVGRPYWGRGFTAEAAKALIDHGFRQLGLTRIEAAAVPANRRSIRVQEKLGFTYVGLSEDPAPARGGAQRVELRVLRRPARRRLLVSAVALVDVDGRVLLARRPAGKPMAGLWEFPGGKVREDETPEGALIRELREELAIDVAESCLAPLTFASHRYPDFDLLMPLYVCRRWNGQPVPQEGQELAWVRAARLADYPMPPADKPLIPMLQDLL
jgi:8-oxo-dGTP diphosphatase